MSAVRMGRGHSVAHDHRARSLTGGGLGPRQGLLVLPVWWAIVVLAAVAVRAAAPGLDGTRTALLVTVVLTAAAVAVAAALRHRPGLDAAALGLTPVARWRHRELLVLPLALSCLPLAAGLRADGDGAALAVLVVGYLLTGFTEELVWRGTVLQLLGPVGDRRAVLVASLLFGSAHLANVLFRGSVALVLAQAFGAFCFGVGYSAIRLRTQALVPLMVAHLLTDLLPHLSRLPAIPVFVAQDVVLLTVGLVLLRRSSSP